MGKIITNKGGAFMKIIFYIIIAIIFLLVTFFGLGPALFADGKTSERVLMVGLVIVVYLMLGYVTVRLSRKK